MSVKINKFDLTQCKYSVKKPRTTENKNLKYKTQSQNVKIYIYNALLIWQPCR